MTAPPVVLVLAAGSGSRFAAGFGAVGHKLAQAFAGTTVLGATVAAVRASGLPLVVVAASATHAIAVACAAAQEIVFVDAAPAPALAPVPAPGMGRSIAAGVAARPAATGWLVLPGDMPLVRPASLRAVAGGLQANTIARARHRGRQGHPVGFRAEHRDELSALTGDDGARGLLARHGVQAVEVDDEGVLLDLDTPADWAALRALQAQRRAAHASHDA